MENKLLNLKYPVVVEGKYDKIKLSSIISSPILTTDGFAVFNNNEKLMLLRRMSESGALIILTDSDKAGFFIRSKLKSYLGNIRLINIYIPKIAGKEKRKTAPGKEGLIGVEGVDKKTLTELLSDYTIDSETKLFTTITKGDFYADGLSGGTDAAAKRDALAKFFGLPEGMTANALLEAVNILNEDDKYREAIKVINESKKD